MSVADLQSLLKEAIKRREKSLQTACEECVPYTPGQEVSVDCMKPFVTGCVSKQPKIVSLCVSTIGSMCTLYAEHISPPLWQSLLAALCNMNLKDTISDDVVGVRLLQTYASMLTSSHFHVPPVLLGTALSQLFLLFASNPKGTVLNSTARATLTQLTQHYFDACKAVEVQDAPALRTALTLLRDLSKVADGNVGQWLRLSQTSVATQSFALDLLNDILVNYHEVLLRFLPLSLPVLRDEICVMVVKGASNGAVPDSALFPRCHRLGVTLLYHFTQPLSDQLDMILGIQTHCLEQRGGGASDTLWVKASVLLPWRTVFQTSTFLRSMHIKGALFQAFFVNVCRVIHSVAEGAVKGGGNGSSGSATTPPGGSSNQLNNSMSSEGRNTSALCLSGERCTLARLESCSHDDVTANDVFVLAFDVFSAFCTAMAKMVDRDKGVAEPCVALYVDLLWGHVLQECSLLLECNWEEDVLQSTLRCCQHMTHCCGWSNKNTPRDSFITCMTRHALPPMMTRPYILTQSNTAVIKVLINLSNGLASVLGNSWYVILKTFQQVEVVLNNLSPEQAALHDVAMLHALLDNVVEASKFIDDRALLQMLQGFVQVSTDVVSTRESLKARPGYFSLSKLTLAVKHNLPRLRLIQELVATYYVAMATSGEDNELKRYSVECAAATLVAYFQSPRSAPEATTQNMLELDIALFSTLVVIQRKANPEVRYVVLVELHRIFQMLGQTFTCSCLSLALSILQSAAGSVSVEEVVFGYRTVELICHDFLASLDGDSTMQLLQCVAAYIRQSASGDKVNLNLSAIQLTWQIGDYLSGRSTSQLTSHWLALFTNLRDASKDPRPEVRHGSLKTLFSLLVTHGKVLPVNIRPTLLRDVLCHLFEAVHTSANSAEKELSGSFGGNGQSPGKVLIHHSRDSVAKQWSETLVVTTEGCVRTSRMLLLDSPDSVESEVWVDYLKRLMRFLSSAILSTSGEELVTTGLKSMNGLLLDLAGECGRVAPAVVWEMAWASWDSFGDVPHKADNVAQNYVTLFVDCMQELREKTTAQQQGGGSWTEFYTRRLFFILQKIMRSAAATQSFYYPSKVQHATLQFLRKALPFQENSTWEGYFHLVATFLPSEAFADTCLASEHTEKAVMCVLLENGYHPDFMDAAIALLLESFTQCRDVRNLLLPEIIKPLSHTIMMRYVNPATFQSWKNAVLSLRSIVTDTLKQTIAAPGTKSNNPAQGFACLYQPPQLAALKDVSVTLHKYYLGPLTVAPSSGPVSAKQSQTKPSHSEDHILLELVEEVLQHPVGSDAAKSYIQFLEKCQGYHGAPASLRLSALKILYRIVSKECKSVATVTLGLPVLYSCCVLLFREYSASAAAPHAPPQHHEEVLIALKLLGELEVPTESWHASTWQAAESAPPPHLVGPKGLLVRLFPAMCELMVAPHHDIRVAVSSLCKLMCASLAIPSIA